MRKVYIIFHKTDFDGRGSAAIINQYYKDKEDFQVINIPFNHGDNLPEYMMWDDDALVYISDISFPNRITMENFLKKFGDNLIWNDHHISSIELYKGLNINGFQRTDYSGIHLTWFWMNREKYDSDLNNIDKAQFPKSVDMIGCRDIRKPLENSEEFDNALSLHREFCDPSYPHWEHILNDDEEVLNLLLKEGQVVTEFKRVQEISASKIMIHFIDFEGLKIPAINSNFVKQEPFELAPGNLYQKYPFVVIYHRTNHGLWKVSMRSHPDQDINLTTIANKYGGGGHKKASAFTVRNLPFKMFSKKKPSNAK